MRARLKIDTIALSKNARTLSKLVGKDFFCPMIKANAYGHGATPVAQVLLSQGFKKLGVISLAEALQLKSLSKDLLKDVQIYIFGPIKRSELKVISKENFIPVIGNKKDLEKIKAFKISYHIEFNLGMNRLGFQKEEASALINYIQSHSDLNLKGVCSHLSQGEGVATELAEKNSREHPIEVFKNIRTQFQKSFPKKSLHFHLLGSSGGFSLWSHDKWESNLGFRPGISLYGLKPQLKFTSSKAREKYATLPLKKVSSLSAFVVQTQTLSIGESVSYGGTWTAKKKSVVAVVSMGYADGLPYNFSNKAEVLFRGRRVAILGRVCMDFFMIDVTQALEKGPLCKGEEVVIFGVQKNNYISVEEQAQKAETIPYELFTRVGNRVQREYF